MQAIITDADKTLLAIIFNRFKGWNKLYIVAGRIRMLKWYNKESKRNICMRTFDYMIARLKNAEIIERSFRTKNMGELGKQFDTSMTKILPKGHDVLFKLGHMVYDIINLIKQFPNVRKKKARPKEVRRAPSKTFTRVGTITNEQVRDLKPS